MRVSRLLVLVVVILMAGISPLLPTTPAAGASLLPAGFVDALVTPVANPTSVAFTPDGGMLVTSQGGELWMVRQDQVLNTPVLDLSNRLCVNAFRGLLGLAVDPDYVNNHYIYLYYTFKNSGGCPIYNAFSPGNRVARFTVTDDVADPASEFVLLDNIPSPGGHEGGDLQFGKDGYLYISVGDGYCDYAANSGCAGENDASRDQNILLGKILRVTTTGDIPANNPFQGEGTARCGQTGRTEPGNKCQETFASGLRNPFRMAFDPNAENTRFFVNDVGQEVWEEINLGQPGADYGWNVREGHCANGSTTDCGPPPQGMTNPIVDYNHSTGCSSITGGAFVPRGIWPVEYDGVYLFADYVCGKIFALGADATYAPFASELGNSSATSMRFGPAGTNQALYYTSYADGGQVRRISYIGDVNQPPMAHVTVDPAWGEVPLWVRFDAGLSSDPDGDTLAYTWNFGDGTTPDTGEQVLHKYETRGHYIAVVSVSDPEGAVATANVRIDVGNTPPTPSITTPAASLRFVVGQAITLTGRAADREDGPLPDPSLQWSVLLHHNTHTHPFLLSTAGNRIMIQAPPPENLQAALTSYLELRLAATDSQGLTSVITRTLRPQWVAMTFTTQPANLPLLIEGLPVSTPRSVISWPGYKLNVAAPAYTMPDGPRKLLRWNDGNTEAARTIISPFFFATYTAVYQTRPSPAHAFYIPMLFINTLEP
jgi:glucose/arabinose dehydrogenase